MNELIFILALFLILGLIRVAEIAYYEGLEREKERVMANYYKAEEARAHYQRLAEIDRAVQATSDEMARIAAEANGEIIEGVCHEIEARPS